MAQPTPRQLEAYVWIYIIGLSNQDAADRMGVSGGQVRKLLRRFFKGRPKLKQAKEKGDKNAISYDYYMDKNISKKF